MRLEATVPDNRGSAIVKLGEELGLGRSQIIDEALALFLKALATIAFGPYKVSLTRCAVRASRTG